MDKTAGKRFVFVNLSIKSGYNSGMNHGIAHLVPILRRHFYQPYLLNLRSELSDVEFLNQVGALNPDIVGFSCVSNQFMYLIRYSRALKSRNVMQLAGGVCATLEPEEVLSKACLDGVCVGEGEVPLEDLLSNMESGRDVRCTKGFFWKTGAGIKKNAVPHFIDDLSTLEFPDYTVFEKSVISNSGVLDVLLSRGCPFDCAYCCNRILTGVYDSPKGHLRFPSVDYSITLIKGLLKQYPCTSLIVFSDDLFISNVPWYEEFSRAYKENIGLPYQCLSRPEYINTGVLRLLRESGCVRIRMGLESGDEAFRRKMLNRNYSNDFFIEKAAMIKEAGIELYVYNIVGFPFEGAKEMNNTLLLNKKVRPNDGVCTFFYPYKGTRLYGLCEENGLLKDEAELMKTTNYNTRPSIKLAPAVERQCLSFQKKITAYLYRQSLKRKYEKFRASHSKVTRGVYFVYLLAVYCLKPFLVRVVYDSKYLLPLFLRLKKLLRRA